METIFLETNAINECLKKNYSGKDLSHILSKKKLTPIVSQHTTYELVRNFTSDKNKHIGISLFTILKNLSPIYTCETKELLKRDVNKLINGTACDFIIERTLSTPLSEAVAQLSLGNTEQHHIDFVNNRELEIKNDTLKQWKPLFPFNKLCDFEDFYEDTVRKRENIIFFIQKMCDIKLDNVQAERLSLHLSDFKVIKTAIRANLYMSYIARNNKTSPSKDKNDDFRHIIDASLCTYFSTNDQALKKYAQIINPEIRLISFNDMIN